MEALPDKRSDSGMASCLKSSKAVNQDIIGS